MHVCLLGGMSASAIPYNNSVGDGIYDVPKNYIKKVSTGCGDFPLLVIYGIILSAALLSFAFI